MKLHHATTLLPLLLCAAFAGAQLDKMGPPPVKMGLWETTVSTQMSGLPNMPAGMPAHKPLVSQSCMTPDRWQTEMTDLQQQMERSRAQCTNARLQHDGNKFIMDEQCSTAGGSSTIHVEWNIDNEESMHGSSDAQLSGSAFPQGVKMHATMTSKFLSSDCGNVKPGEAKVMQ